MKKTLLTLTATLAAVAAFAQGKVAFQNDSLHLVYMSTDSSKLMAGDAALAGQLTPLPTTTLPSGVTLAADLYMGTSSSSLALYSSTVFNATAPGPGKWGNVNVQAVSPLILGGTSVFAAVQVRDSAAAASAAYTGTRPNNNYYGTTPIFNFTLGSAPTYPVLWGAQGNWPVGQYNADSSAYGPGARGAIELQAVGVPEPTSFALAGLGVAAMLVIRRRK